MICDLLLGTYMKNSSKKPKTRKLTKADIGMPQDFKHITHVGWDANKGISNRFTIVNFIRDNLRFSSRSNIKFTNL